jgi:hypothetical protein
VWTAQPTINNQIGKIDFQGGIPGGINVSSGLVTTLTFRVKSVGTAAIRFADNSKILLHDGKGTNDLNNTNNGVYTLSLPPPAGPIVSSETHPEQNYWYTSVNPLITWAADSNVEGYSYVLSQEPIDIPDDIVDSNKNSVVYKNIGDGTHYFHIKAFRNGSWGGTTHFAIKIDSTPPADFKINTIPDTRTVRRQPIFEFQTTDSFSGIGHYETKLINLTEKNSSGQQSLFIETTSPFIPSQLEIGDYDFIVRAYDLAGNFREVKQKISIVTWTLEFITNDGFRLPNYWVIPWIWFWTLILIIIFVLVYFGLRLKKLHLHTEQKHINKELPNDIKEKLYELNKYKQKYGKIMGIFLLAIFSSYFFYSTASAQIQQTSPPYITTISNQISNQEIFYVGGKADAAQVKIILHLQNLQTGETYNYETESDKKGDWLYTHNQFLNSGKYIVWAQSKIADQESAPSPQQEIFVSQTAVQFGSSRLSYESIYAIGFTISILTILILVIYNIFHFKKYKTKQRLVLEEAKKAEESLKRAFAVLRRDIQAELELINKVKVTGQVSNEHMEKEEMLLKDLKDVEELIGNEIWELEKLQNQNS